MENDINNVVTDNSLDDNSIIDNSIIDDTQDDVSVTAGGYYDYYYDTVVSQQRTIITNQETIIANQDSMLTHLDNIAIANAGSCMMLCVILCYFFIKSIFRI